MSFPKYPKYKDSGEEWLGEVPEHWGVRQLKRCVRLITAKADERSNPLALENIEGWTGRLIPSEGDYQGEGTAFAAGDILFGKLRPYLAKVHLASQPGEAVGDFHVLRPGEGFDGHFAQYHMLTREFIDIVDGSTYGSKMPRASWEFVGGMPMAVPPPAEQPAIATFLDRETAKIDALIAEQRRLIELLQEKRQAVISHAVTKGLNSDVPMKDSGIEWLGEVPQHWHVVPLHRIVQERRPITYGIVQPGPPDETGRFMIRNQDFTNGWANPESVFRVSEAVENPYKRARMKPNDLIMTIVGAVGSIGVIPEWLDGANTTQNIARIAIDAAKSDFRYIASVLQGPVGTRNVEFYSKGSVQTSLNLEHVRLFWVTVPPLEEQFAIVELIESKTSGLDALTAEAARGVELLQERRTALISAAVTGQIDVRGLAGAEAA